MPGDTLNAIQVQPDRVEASAPRCLAPLIVFAGGGTGGHLYPALAVATALRELLPAIRLVFFATQRKVDEDIVANAGEHLVTQPVRPLSTRPWRWPAMIKSWRASVRQCRSYFEAHRPAVVVGSGGFGSGPALRQAVRMGLPTALLNPDAMPGRANRLLARRVSVVFAQWAETLRHFPSGVNVQVTGCPIRAAFAQAEGLNRADVLARFRLSPQRRTLLVTGASQGAHTINMAMLELVAMLAARPGWQILHLTGAADLGGMITGYERAGVAHSCLAFTHDMPAAMFAADLVVSRAGASTLAELTGLGKPAVLLPYPFGRDRHQWSNANVLAERGAAVLCPDEMDARRTAARLGGQLSTLMENEVALQRMGRAARGLGDLRAAERIARSVIILSHSVDLRNPA